MWSPSSPAASAADVINRYLFLPTPSPALNRSSAFALSPGVCPTVGPEAPTSPCALDTDCPGLQKCCPWSGGHRCMVPAPQGRTEMCSEGGVQLGSPGGWGPGPDLVEVPADCQEHGGGGAPTAGCRARPLPSNACLPRNLATAVSGRGCTQGPWGEGAPGRATPLPLVPWGAPRARWKLTCFVVGRCAAGCS